jgi:hypothetical protein
MNSLLYPKLFGEAGERFAETVRRLSGGSFIIEVHDRLVLDQETFGALESGLIDAVWGSAGHHHREDPALTIFSGFPFGPDPGGFTAWMQVGGGGEALQAIYARHGMKSLYCGILPSEGGGWFLEPIDGIEDLEGLAVRSFGYGARVLQKLGVTTYELPAQEVRPALETGLIGAAVALLARRLLPTPLVLVLVLVLGPLLLLLLFGRRGPLRRHGQRAQEPELLGVQLLAAAPEEALEELVDLQLQKAVVLLRMVERAPDRGELREQARALGLLLGEARVARGDRGLEARTLGRRHARTSNNSNCLCQ